MTLREELEQIYVFETTELKSIQHMIDGSLDVAKLDLKELFAMLFVMHKAETAMVMRLADELDAVRG